MMLVDFVEENHDFLTEALNNGKTRQMINKKWEEAPCSINSLGLHPIKLTATQLKRKWADTKSQCKKKY